MTIEIEKKIVGFEVASSEEEAAAPAVEEKKAEEHKAEIIQMHEKLERPEMLLGSTYKIKTPMSEHALYVTINDVVLNPGTDHEHRQPFEIFINSKNMDHFQWIVALTRIISAVFRKGGDVTFLVEELRSVFDPKGGYFKKGGRYTPSLVADIGDAIECHMKMIGMIETTQDDCQREFLKAKRAEYEAKKKGEPKQVEAFVEEIAEPVSEEAGASDFPPESQMCNKCSTKAVISMDGCMTCLNCGDSKCG